MNETYQNVEKYVDKYGHLFIEYLPNLISAAVIFIIGWWVTKIITRLLRRFFDKKDYDEALEQFLYSLISWALKILVLILVITQLGVKSSSLVAVMGAMGLAVGLALQGSLANFAGGVLILLFRPFRVGHFIKAQNIEGTVKEISIFTTKLLTFGNQLAVIPNGKLSNDSIINYSEEGMRRDAITFGIGYNDNIKEAKTILETMMCEREEVLQTEGKAPQVVVAELADSSVNLSARFWAANEHFWDLHFYFIEEGKQRLEAAGISIPFPQREVHVYEQK